LMMTVVGIPVLILKMPPACHPLTAAFANPAVSATTDPVIDSAHADVIRTERFEWHS